MNTNEILKQFDEKFGFYEIYICADCGHTKEDHYWNGGGCLENSGYDSCRADNCKCISENWKIEKQKEENKAFKDFLAESIQQAVAEERARAVGEGVHLGVNNFETWMKQYHEDKDFVGSFGDWIDKLLTSTQEKD